MIYKFDMDEVLEAARSYKMKKLSSKTPQERDAAIDAAMLKEGK